MSRIEFSQPTKETLAKRVAYRCSNPGHGVLTTGPHTEVDRHVNIGVAAHITAASVGGPRFDESISAQQRSSADNGIWLCQSCAKLIDNDEAKYTVALLVQWKVDAERRATKDLEGLPENEFFPQPVSAAHTPIPRIASIDYDQARNRLIQAGWQPLMNHWCHASNFDMQYGNGLYFWSKGYHEIRHASGTGLAMCSFGFEDVYGHRLVVVTAGEAIKELGVVPGVWRWYLEARASDA